LIGFEYKLIPFTPGALSPAFFLGSQSPGRGMHCLVVLIWWALAELERGSMGIVYKAQNLKYDRLIAY
jgi:hypothetical protein